MRKELATILSEIKDRPVELTNYACIKLLADIMRFVMTLFVHEHKIDFDLLSIVLDTCQAVHYGTARSKRKVFLSSLIMDHGIWGDTTNWRDMIEYTIR